MSKQILLVGTDSGLAPETLALSPEFKEAWTISHVGNGTQAQELIEKSKFNAVVTELRLPNMRGDKLLDFAMKRQPSSHRFILADLTDRQTMLQCVGAAHPFLAKPCNATKLEAAIGRSLQMETWFGREAVKKIVAQTRKVPSPPTLYFQILKELQSPEPSLDKIKAIVSQDMAITAKLLAMVNSGDFGFRHPVSSAAEAVAHLGMEATTSLVLLAHAYAHFDRIPPSIFSVQALWRHSLTSGRLARDIARSERSGESVIDQSFTAGLLHDMGKLVLAANNPDVCRQVHEEHRRTQRNLWQIEQEAFATNHAQVGAWLAAIWGLPLPIIESLALHHQPGDCISGGFSPLTAVHCANVIDHELQTEGADVGSPGLDMNYLTAQGLADRAEFWRELGRNLAPRAHRFDELREPLAA